MRKSMTAALAACALMLTAGVAAAADATTSTTPPTSTTTPPKTTTAPKTTDTKKPAAPKTAESIECSKQADAKGLHGDPRKKFRAACKAALKAGKPVPDAAPAPKT